MTYEAIWLRLRALFNRSGVEAELADELHFHLEKQAEMLRQQGYSEAEAFRRARLAFGSVEDTKETYRDERGTRAIEDFFGDVRYALRTLWRDRALAVAGVLTLALGIGATTAVFSAVNAVMLRQLPFADPGRLVQVWEENPDRGWYKNVVAPANFFDWSEQVDAFTGVAGYVDWQTNVTLIGVGEPRILSAAAVTGNFLRVLGVRPLYGPGLQDADTWNSGQRPAMISHRVWQTYFKGDTGVIGRSYSFGGRPKQIVGVLPPEFAFPSPSVDVWLPTLFDRNERVDVNFRRAHWLRVVARLKPGVSQRAADASLQTVVKRLQAEYPQTNTHMGAGITPLHEFIVGDTRRPLVVLLAAAAVLLLIACANVGNLLLVHALGRGRDVALRFALGATRGRVARQALTESLVMSAAGGVTGFVLGWVGARGLLAVQPEGMLPITSIALDYRILLFATVVTTLSGLVFGMAPALIATRQSPSQALNTGGRTMTGGRVRRWGRHLVLAEVALAVMLMVGAGLLLRSYERLSRVPPGFDPQGVLTARVAIPESRYDSASQAINFYSTLLLRLGTIPGVERAAAVSKLPVTVASWSSDVSIEGRGPAAAIMEVVHREVLGDYFRTMRVPLIGGRNFTDADRLSAPLVVIINETLARQLFKTENPLGQRICFDKVPDSTSHWRTVVGVVGSEHQGSLALPARAEVFAPMPQDWTREMSLVVRTVPGRDPLALVGSVRLAVRGLDSLLALSDIESMTQIHRDATSRQRFTSMLVLVFALTGVLLALVGVFGILAQLVQTREREMGIRMALGAQRAQVGWLVVRHGASLVGGGILAGLLVALLTTRVLATLLYEVEATDPLTYAAVAALIAIVGTVAAWIPARRASAADPALTLRAE